MNPRDCEDVGVTGAAKGLLLIHIAVSDTSKSKSHLATSAPSPILPPLHKAPVKVCSDWPLVYVCPIQILDCVLCVAACVIDYKAEAAGCLAMLV